MKEDFLTPWDSSGEKRRDVNIRLPCVRMFPTKSTVPLGGSRQTNGSLLCLLLQRVQWKRKEYDRVLLDIQVKTPLHFHPKTDGLI
jgi:hypothetical protein